MSRKPKEESYVLPPPAVRTIGDPGATFELHNIAFSHYCDRARWALRLLGIPYKECNYLPFAHMPAMATLLLRFRQGPGSPTLSGSPLATPCLAIYDAQGKPVSLIQNSALITRYASLHATALASKSTESNIDQSTAQSNIDQSTSAVVPASLYGPSSLRMSEDGFRVVGEGELYDQIAELELRLSNVMGVETRRLAYHFVLPQPHLVKKMFRENSSGFQQTASAPLAAVARTLLPRLMKITPATAAKGKERLLREFDFFDQLLLQGGYTGTTATTAAATAAAGGSAVEAQAAAASDSGDGAGGGAQGGGAGRRTYLCGGSLTAADVSLAALAGPLLGLGDAGLNPRYLPGLEEMPEEMRALVEELKQRPTGRYVHELWRLYGPLAATATAKL